VVSGKWQVVSGRSRSLRDDNQNGNGNGKSKGNGNGKGKGKGKGNGKGKGKGKSERNGRNGRTQRAQCLSKSLVAGDVRVDEAGPGVDAAGDGLRVGEALFAQPGRD